MKETLVRKTQELVETVRVLGAGNGELVRRCLDSSRKIDSQSHRIRNALGQPSTSMKQYKDLRKSTLKYQFVDTNFVENCDSRYIGRISGDNNRRKLKGFGISKEEIATIQNLPRGKFLMHCGTSTSIEDVPYFKSPIKPNQYVEPQKPKKPSLIQRIIKGLLRFSALIIGKNN